MSDEAQTEMRESEEHRLETEMLERREAALAHVVKFGDPVLKSKASPVSGFGPELRSEVERGERKLGNEGFVAKAPAEVVESEREKLSRYRAELVELGG